MYSLNCVKKLLALTCLPIVPSLAIGQTVVVMPYVLHVDRVPVSAASVDAVLAFAFITFPRLLARLSAWRLDLSREVRDAPRAIIVGM